MNNLQGLRPVNTVPQPERQPEVLKALDTLSIALSELGTALGALSSRLDKVSRMPGPQANTKSEAAACSCHLETDIRDKVDQVHRYLEAVTDMRDRLEV